MHSYDLIVISYMARPAEKGAAQASYFGKRVALIERAADLGGACVNTGTIPSKILANPRCTSPGSSNAGFMASTIRSARA